MIELPEGKEWSDYGLRTISWSRFKSYAECPELFRLHYMDKTGKDRERPNIAAMRGTVLHSLIEGWEKGDRAWSDADLWMVHEALWAREIAKASEFPVHEWRCYGPRCNPEEYLAKSRELSWNLFETFRTWKDLDFMHPAKINGEYALELSVETPAGTLAPMPTLGYIDSVYEHDKTHELTIVDVKSGSAPTGPGQLLFYRDMLQAAKGVTVRWGQYWAGGQKPGPKPYYDLDLWPEGVAREWIEEFIAGVLAGAFPPNPGQHCFSCDERIRCRLWSPQSKP